MRARDWALILVGCLVGAGAAAWLVLRSPPPVKPPPAARVELDPEPEPRSQRVAISRREKTKRK